MKQWLSPLLRTIIATIDALLLRVDELESAGLGGTALVTTQVTGEYPVPTVGGWIISDDTELTAVTFADAFSNGISHALRRFYLQRDSSW